MPQSEPAVEALSPLTRISPEVEVKDLQKHERTLLSHDFRYYEITVLAITQLSYIPIASTMLAITFFEPSEHYCNNTKLEAYPKESANEFYSLLFDWGSVCTNDPIIIILSMTLMSGALLGSFIAGWLADLYGRCPVLKGCLFIVFCGNILVYFFASSSVIATFCLFFLLGSACGGYMVVNLVIFVECLELPRSRLFAVSANGWSISMVAVAAMAYITSYWKYYHLAVAAAALIAYIACSILLVESCRWLDSVQKMEKAYSTAVFIANRNQYNIQPDWFWWELLGFSSTAAHLMDPTQTSNYNYLDLFRTTHVCVPLLALAYCFAASSIVSFGFYFILDILPGSRYVNMSVMGLSKFAMGWIPFFVSPWMGRRPLVLGSVGVATVAAWLACLSFLLGVPKMHWIHVALSLIITASLDPTWKILHLYSTELFPTAIRNMARAFCNVGSRLGSVIAPSVVYLRIVHPVAPLSAFTVLLTFQLFIVLLYLPETHDKPLPSSFSPYQISQNQRTGSV